jgi:pSer/pThr/pTyr-binding forkhead associated (FHA) protein
MDSKFSRFDLPAPSVTARQSQQGPHYLSQLPQVGLEIVRGKASRRIREVNPPVFLVGAAEDCDLVLGDLRFPEAYAYLYVTIRGVSVRHLGEGPELYVNGELTESALLADGDILELGAYEFQLHIQDRTPRGQDRNDRDWEELRETDFLGLDAAMDDVWDLMARIRESVPLEPVDLRIFSGPPAPKVAKRPLAAFVSRRISA